MCIRDRYSFSIAVDEANADIYGIASISITAVNEEMTEWSLFGYDESLGRDGYGTFTIGAPYTPMTFSPIRVFERHLPSDENVQQFIMQIYDGEAEDDADIEHNDNMNDPEWLQVMAFNSNDGCKSISITPTEFVLDPSLSISDANTLMPDRFPNASSFDPVTGVFTLNVMCYDAEGAYNPSDWYINLTGYLDTNDYSVSLTDKGQVKIADKDYAVIGYTATSHVDYSCYTVVNSLLKEDGSDKVLDEEAYFKVVEGITGQVLDPDNAESDYVIEKVEGQNTNISLSFPASGEFTMVAVAFHADNSGTLEAKSNAYVNFSYETFNPFDGWTVVSEDAVYYDNIVANLFGAADFANYPATVTLAKSDEYEGLYRIFNPFAEFAQYGLSVEDFGYLDFDASDPEHVYFPLSKSGILNGTEPIGIMSTSFYLLNNDMGVDEIPAEYWGTFKDNVVTLAAIADPDADPNFLAQVGSGLYKCDADFELDFNASAAKPGKIAKKLGSIIKTQMMPAKTVATKAYFKVKSVSKSSRKAQKAVFEGSNIRTSHVRFF